MQDPVECQWWSSLMNKIVNEQKQKKFIIFEKKLYHRCLTGSQISHYIKSLTCLLWDITDNFLKLQRLTIQNLVILNLEFGFSINLSHITGLSLSPWKHQKTSKIERFAKMLFTKCFNLEVFWCFQGDRKRLVAWNGLRKLSTYVMFCTIWCHLNNLKDVKKNHGGVLILIKLQTLTSNFTKSNSSMGVFHVF